MYSPVTKQSTGQKIGGVGNIHKYVPDAERRRPTTTEREDLHWKSNANLPRPIV